MNHVNSRLPALCGAVFAFTAVLLGAFGAHGLAELLAERGSAATWETAVRYQMWHSLALLLCGFGSVPRSRLTLFSSLSFAAGIPLFSGSLYLLALGGPSWLGPVTPLGGLLFLAGWSCLAVAALPKKSNP